MKTPDGLRTTHVVEGTLTFAKKVEAKIKADIAQKKHLNVGPSPRIEVVWEKYLARAKKKKKSWYDDNNRWTLHVEPFVKERKMDAISRATVA